MISKDVRGPITQWTAAGGTIGLAVAETVFSSQLTKNLARYAPTAPVAVIKESPVSIYTKIAKELVPSVVHAYVKSVRTVFIVGELLPLARGPDTH